MLDELEDEMLFLDEVNRSENLTLDNITLDVNDNQSLTQVTIKRIKQKSKQKNIEGQRQSESDPGNYKMGTQRLKMRYEGDVLLTKYISVISNEIWEQIVKHRFE